MDVRNLTEALVRELRAQAADRYEVRDAKVPALLLRLSPTSASWYVRKRPPGGLQPVRVLLGKVDDLSVALLSRLADRDRCRCMAGGRCIDRRAAQRALFRRAVAERSVPGARGHPARFPPPGSTASQAARGSFGRDAGGRVTCRPEKAAETAAPPGRPQSPPG